jgi:AcrR family transcriptional regulator
MAGTTGRAVLDPGDPRERLVEAAERLFAERGFEGASVREITTAAGCNVAAVSYHFGGKEELYRAVFVRRLAALREQRVGALHQALGEAGEHADLDLVLRTFVTSFLEPLREEGRGRLLMSLFAREMQDPRLPRGVFAEEMVIPVQRAMVGALQRVEPDLESHAAERCVHSVVAQVLHVLHLGRLADAGASHGVDGLDLSRMADHIVEFSAAGIRHLARRP